MITSVKKDEPEKRVSGVKKEDLKSEDLGCLRAECVSGREVAPGVLTQISEDVNFHITSNYNSTAGKLKASSLSVATVLAWQRYKNGAMTSTLGKLHSKMRTNILCSGLSSSAN